jgi:DNA-binding NarL/FixJ family response regulator
VNMMPVRVLVVDDHDGFRSALVAALALVPELLVAGEAVSGEEACDHLIELSPDVVLMDYSMPGMNGLDATRRIRLLRPGTRVIMLTGTEGDGLEQYAFAAGASAFLRKGTSLDDLVEAVLAAAGDPVWT